MDRLARNLDDLHSASIIICAIRATISRSTSGDAVARVSSNHSP
ncbi:hypothetical protein [Nonomuraea maheshkhaliensis]